MPLPVSYLISQSVLVAIWWMAIALMPDLRDWFRPAGAPDVMLLSFWLADFVCIVFGSALAALWLHRRDRRRTPALWFTSGALVYATLYCIGVASMSGEAWLGVLLMAPAAVVTLLIARAESR